MSTQDMLTKYLFPKSFLMGISFLREESSSLLADLSYLY